MAKLEDFLSTSRVQRLKQRAITSVDDLYTVLREDRTAVSALLDLDDDDTRELDAAIRQEASSDVVEALDAQDDVPRPLDRGDDARSTRREDH